MLASCCLALCLACSAAQAEEVAAGKPALVPELCEPGDQEPCEFEAFPSGDHFYIFPRADAGSLYWRDLCGKSRQIAEPGVPEFAREELRPLPIRVLQRWVAAGGVLNQELVRTITFCGFSVTDILDLDWSATDARIRFFLTKLTSIRDGSSGDAPGDRLPGVIFPSRGLFSSGLTIDQSVLSQGVNIHDAQFGSFVEIERSVIEQSFAVRNTVVGGALRLRHNDFAHNLRLEALEVAGDTILSHNNFPAEITASAIEPDGTAGSVVRLRELRLRGVLQVVGNSFAASPPSDGAPEPAPEPAPELAKDPLQTVSRSFYLQKSLVSDNDVTIAGNTFSGHVFLVDVEGKRLSIADNTFPGILHITGSNFFSVRTYDNNFHLFVQLRSNQIDSSLIVDRDRFANAAKRIEIVGNAIGQEMRISPRWLPRDGGTLTLAHNRVTGPADLHLPLLSRHRQVQRPDLACEDLWAHLEVLEQGGFVAWPEPETAGFARWRGMLDFTGSHFDSSLTITETCHFEQTSAMIPIHYDPRHVRNQLRQWQDERACHEGDRRSPHVLINFSLVSAALLDLRVMPHGCDYMWRGVNLSFDYFGPHAEGETERLERENGPGHVSYNFATAINLLSAWLRNVDHADPGLYLGISDYLRNRGDLNGSREWLARAKEVTYQPAARPAFFLGAAADADGLQPDEPSWWQWLEQQVVFWALLPAGYGAMPERVIKWLAGIWLVSWFFYFAHWRGWLNTLRVAWTRLFDAENEPLGATRSGLPDGGGRLARSLREARAAQRAWSERRRELARAGPPAGSALTSRHGFVVAKTDQVGRRFSLWSYALDVTLPIIPLGRFGVFVPDNAFVRGFSYLHHILGWWLGALFIGALTIL